MALRYTVFPLDGLPIGVPVPLVLSCDYWFLRVGLGADKLTIDGVNGENFGTLDGSAKAAVSIDFPPIFDANGRPVRWNQRIVFLASTSIRGSVVQVTDDAGLPQGPR